MHALNKSVLDFGQTWASLMLIDIWGSSTTNRDTAAILDKLQAEARASTPMAAEWWRGAYVETSQTPHPPSSPTSYSPQRLMLRTMHLHWHHYPSRCVGISAYREMYARSRTIYSRAIIPYHATSCTSIPQAVRHFVLSLLKPLGEITENFSERAFSDLSK